LNCYHFICPLLVVSLAFAFCYFNCITFHRQGGEGIA
jgi:hypothetical protein